MINYKPPLEKSLNRWFLRLKFRFFRALDDIRVKKFPFNKLSKLRRSHIDALKFILTFFIYFAFMGPTFLSLMILYFYISDPPGNAPLLVGLSQDIAFLFAEYFDVYFALCILCALLISVFRLIIDLEQKARRDRAAWTIWESTLSGQSSEFVLYLRRFFSDVGITVGSRFVAMLPNIVNWRDRSQIDERIGKYLPESCPLIKIGTRYPGDFGSGTIVVTDSGQSSNPSIIGNDDWEAAFQTLATKARWIVATPISLGDSALLQEMRFLNAQGLKEKLILIMPQNVQVIENKDTEIKDINRMSNIWRRAQKNFSTEIGIELPEYRRRGGFLICSGSRFELFSFISGRIWFNKKAVTQLLIDGLVHAGKIKNSFRFAVDNAKFSMLVFSIILIYFYNAPSIPEEKLGPTTIFLLFCSLIFNSWYSFFISFRYFQRWKKYIAVFLVFMVIIGTHFACYHFAPQTIAPILFGWGLENRLFQISFIITIILAAGLLTAAPSYLISLCLAEKKMSIVEWQSSLCRRPNPPSGPISG